jgi:hypothetical protein
LATGRRGGGGRVICEVAFFELADLVVEVGMGGGFWIGRAKRDTSVQHLALAGKRGRGR